MRRELVVVSLLGLSALAAGPARADSNDLVMARLAKLATDSNGNVVGAIGQNADLRSLASQLGVVLAPHLLTPADTLGFGGFQLTVDYTTTSIDSNASYWRALSTPTAPSMMSTVGMFVRKGMWFPIPSFEVGAGAIHLVDSHTWTGQLYAKVALHEGYHDLPLPSLAVRGGVSRMFTQRELDLTVASLDVTVSKHLGIGDTWRLDPFGGWNLLMIVPRSEVIDPTPNIDPLTPGNQSDIMNNFVFAEQDTIYRHRFFVGAKFQYYILQFTVEAQFALAGSSVDDRAGTSDPCTADSMTERCDAKDTAAAQRTFSFSAGLDF